MDRLQIQKVALRQRALFIDDAFSVNDFGECAADFCAEMLKLGYVPDEKLLRALNGVNAEQLAEIYSVVKEGLNLNSNWTPLVKDWLKPTGESRIDHLITAFVNSVSTLKDKLHGVRLPCGHLIPEGTFPIERYNGCPFCGTPFEFSDKIYKGQGSKHKLLTLWTLTDVNKYFHNLLNSPVALDATQRDSLNILLHNLPLPSDVQIVVKETIAMVVDVLLEQGKPDLAAEYFTSPNDILRYLWYKKTLQIQIIKPSILIDNAKKSTSWYFGMPVAEKQEKENCAAAEKRKELKLHYSRSMCRIVARWINDLKMSAEVAAEIMHPKRGMWVRFIRALRLSEFAKQKGFENLRKLLDIFYRGNYKVWQGEVDKLLLKNDIDGALRLLQQRPGSFARQLFSVIIRNANAENVIDSFAQIAPQIAPRLLVTLGMYAESYFDNSKIRTVKVITGKSKNIENPFNLQYFADEDIKRIIASIQKVYADVSFQRFKNTPTDAKTIYIDPQLFDIPLSIGERSANIQDTDCALLGTKFDLQGDKIRLFMHWGKGLPAQHLDMDLSARIVYQTGEPQECCYYELTLPGAQHSGDIRHIPDQIGTAEFVELDIPVLRQQNAKYVVFTCNAYSDGNLSPNLAVGWMDSKNPMKVSDETGAAYDPSCVIHQVRISSSTLSKGLVFGVLDVQTSKITWLEMPFEGQMARNLDLNTLEGYLQKLSARTKIGELLRMKANAQNLQIVDNKDIADEIYDYNWALDTAKVSALLL